MNKLLLIIAFLGMAFIAQSQDYNFEFVTDGTAYLAKCGQVPHDSTMLYLPCRVIKEYDHLRIVSNRDFSGVRFEGDVQFVGMNENRDLLYYYSMPAEEKEFYILISPIDGLVKINLCSGETILQYGSRWTGDFYTEGTKRS